MGYLSPAIESGVNNAFQTLHHYFADRNEFKAIKEGETTIIDNSQDFNFFQQNLKPVNEYTQKTYETGTFYARYYYLSAEDIQFNDGNLQENSNIRIPEGSLKIITDVTGKGFIETANIVHYENNPFEVSKTPERHGLLQKNFYTFLLTPSK